jgi:hypothetical protein
MFVLIPILPLFLAPITTATFEDTGGKPPAAAASKPMMAPKPATWDEMSRDVFDPAWLLPENLRVAAKEGSGPAWELVPKMTELATRVADRSKDDPAAPRCLGDIVLEVLKAPMQGKDMNSVFERVKKAQPELWKSVEPCIRELLCSTRLYAAKWDPDEDDACDGIFFARPLTLEGVSTAPWKKIDDSKLVQQCAVLAFADFEAIKEAENDYTTYPKRPHTKYRSIYPVEGSFVVGEDPRKHAFSALRLFFSCDLPFPFSHYDCDLHILNRTDGSGSCVCDIYSTSKDFHWLAGRDVFLPVRTSDGTWVCTLIVRLFGMDLDGVPDGDDDRRAGMRTSLGSLKRDSEAAFGRYGGNPRTVEGRVPEFHVLGRK